MAEAIRQTDWSLTPLDPSHQWPASLRMAVTPDPRSAGVIPSTKGAL